MNSKLKQPVLLLFSIAGLAVSLFLVRTELSEPGFCPPFFGVPACFLISAAFALIALSVFIRKNHYSILIFHIGFLPGFIMGLTFSIKNLIAGGVCPVLLGIPLCYVSLVVFLFLGIFRMYFWD